MVRLQDHGQIEQHRQFRAGVVVQHTQYESPMLLIFLLHKYSFHVYLFITIILIDQVYLEFIQYFVHFIHQVSILHHLRSI